MEDGTQLPIVVLLLVIIGLLITGFGLWGYVLYIFIALVVLAAIRYSYTGIRWLFVTMLRMFRQVNDPKVNPRRQGVSFLLGVSILIILLFVLGWIIEAIRNV